MKIHQPIFYRKKILTSMLRVPWSIDSSSNDRRELEAWSQLRKRLLSRWKKKGRIKKKKEGSAAWRQKYRIRLAVARRGWDVWRGVWNATNGVAAVEGKRLRPGEVPSTTENACPFTFYGWLIRTVVRNVIHTAIPAIWRYIVSMTP